MVQRAAVVAGVVFMLCALAVPGAAQAAPTWLDPGAPLSAGGADASNLDIAMSPAGDTLAVWLQGPAIQSSFRPAGGTFGPVVPVPFLADGTASSDPRVVFSGSEAIVTFMQFRSGEPNALAQTVRAADGSFAPAKVLSRPGQSLSGLARFDSNHAGDVVAVWEESGNTVVMAFRPAGGDFGPVTAFPFDGAQGYDGAVDPQGNALVVWDLGTSIQSSRRPAGGAFGDPVAVVAVAEDVIAPTVEVGASGEAVVVFLRSVTLGDRRAWAAVRPAGGGAFELPQKISVDDANATSTGAAVTAQGDAVALYGTNSYPWAAVAAAGALFAPAVRLSPPAHNTYSPRIATAPDGTTHVFWKGDGEDAFGLLRHVIRPPGGSFGPMVTLPGGPATSQYHSFGLDGQGNAAAMWLRADGADDRVVVAGYDAAGPQLRGLAIPTAGVPGASLDFGVTPVDVWSAVTSTAWAFGDGTTAPGTSVAHAYAAPGMYPATVTATDALENASSAGGPVAVAAPVVPPGAGPGGTGTSDRTAPTLSDVRLAPARFRAAAKGATLAATAIGTTVRFTLSEAASVRFTAQRALPGRRVGRSCRKPTAGNRRRARCTRYVAVKGSATRAGVTGANRVKFRGRLNGRKLAPGRYRLLVRATDAARNTSGVRRVTFRIVRR